MQTLRPKLTTEQRETLVCLAQGMSNEEIAKKLIISCHTVTSRVSRLLKRLGLRNRTELAIMAIAWGVVELDEAVEVITGGRHAECQQQDD